MVFPEGARGTAKLYKERHSLVHFGTGFVRLALEDQDAHRALRLHRRRRGHPHGGQLVRARASSSARPTCPITPYLFAVPLPGAARGPLRRADASSRARQRGRRGDRGYVEQVKARIAELIDVGRAAPQRRDRARRGGAHEGPRHRHLRQDRAASSPSACSPRATRSIGIDRRPWRDAPAGVDDARGRHPQARRRGRVPQAPPRGGHPHGDGHPPRRAGARSATASTSAARAPSSTTRAPTA